MSEVGLTFCSALSYIYSAEEDAPLDILLRDGCLQHECSITDYLLQP
jgi:hypothetical protein